MTALIIIAITCILAVAISRASARASRIADDIERQEYQKRNNLKGK